MMKMVYLKYWLNIWMLNKTKFQSYWIVIGVAIISIDVGSLGLNIFRNNKTIADRILPPLS